MSDAIRRLIVFTRYPQPGRVKTRLIPALGASGAAKLHSVLTERTLATAQQLCRDRRVEVEIRYSDADWRRVYRWLDVRPADGSTDLARAAGTLPSGSPVRLRPQSGADLGARMHDAFVEAHHDGCQAIIIGTDVPGLTITHLGDAIDALAWHDLVIGPATDGGYYLIGLRSPRPDLFADMPWGTDDVLTRTLDRARSSRLDVHLVGQLSDIDRPEDLPLLAEFADLAELWLRGWGTEAKADQL